MVVGKGCVGGGSGVSFWWTMVVEVARDGGDGGWCMKHLYKLKDQTCNLLTKLVNESWKKT